MNKKFLIPGLSAIGVVAGIATGGSISGLVANAATSTSSTSLMTSSQTAAVDESKATHQANGKSEVLLTGDNLAKATAAAEKSASGATVLRAETDVDGDGTYEVHMQKSDGSRVTVYLDASFNVTSTQSGPDRGAGKPSDNTDSTTTQ